LKSENNSYLLTTSSTQILHLLLAICCNNQNYCKLHKKRETKKSVQEQAAFCINLCPKKPPKNLGEKKSYFLKNSSTKILIFYLRICYKSSTLLMQIVKRKETLFAREQQHTQRSSLPHHFP